jgi:RhtX/FptX family siderophore transporter
MMVRMKQLHIWAMVALLYISQGIPLGLAMEALPAILRHQGASLERLSLLPLVGLPWVLKFIWATAVDNHYQAGLGRRRSWIVPMQTMVVLCFIASAWVGISEQTTLVIIVLAALGSLASATQDIATDGLTAETFSGPALARANALQVGGTMVGFFIGGPGMLMLSGMLGQKGALLGLAMIVGASLLLVSLWREPHRTGQVLRHKASLQHFIKRPQSLRLAVLAVLSAMVAVAGFGLSKLILVDAGWALEEVGKVGLVGGMATVILGCGGGAWLVGRFGAQRIFMLAIAISAIASCLWMYLVTLDAALPVVLVWCATIGGCFGAGMTSVAMMTIAMGFARQHGQAGTDMTAIQSARDLGEIVTSSSLTRLAGSTGYAGSLLVGVVCAVSAIWLMRSVRVK